jgi:hypothetical protein
MMALLAVVMLLAQPDLTPALEEADTLGVLEADTLGVLEADSLGVLEADTLGVLEADTLGVLEADSSQVLEVGPDSSAWNVAADVTAYFGPSDDAYAVPVLAVEFKGFYVEGRYNYEDFHTGSILMGWHFGIGSEDLGANITPLFGAAFGRTEGLAPALLFDFIIGRVALDSELEYVALIENSSESFAYGRSDLSYHLPVGLSVGIVGETTKTLEGSERDFVPGILVGIQGKRLDATFYLFDPGHDEARGGLELEVGF